LKKEQKNGKKAPLIPKNNPTMVVFSFEVAGSPKPAP